MKKSGIIAALLLVAVALAAAAYKVMPQEPLSPTKTEVTTQYCQIVGTSRLLSNRVTIEIDYGQERKYFAGPQRVLDENDQVKVFNSMIDALNFMAERGWQFVQAYVITSGNQNVYHYMMKREIIPDDKTQD